MVRKMTLEDDQEGDEEDAHPLGRVAAVQLVALASSDGGRLGLDLRGLAWICSRPRAVFELPPELPLELKSSQF